MKPDPTDNYPFILQQLGEYAKTYHPTVESAESDLNKQLLNAALIKETLKCLFQNGNIRLYEITTTEYDGFTRTALYAIYPNVCYRPPNL
jgi:hypothetical protein